ncbi:hypothetical protein [Pseudomonas putida]|uniref:hypothetical protein n=1 Tax=Pseudomonas putida TaxID=303 RepID=UPI0023646B15|nr:hypothetical protein [Pseudomonas putida]HDS1708392.1 hypothetical protein [Pseudomonas putida]
MTVSNGRRMLSHLEGEALQRIGILKGDAERLAKVIGGITAVDQNTLERAMIALRRALAKLEDAVTRNAAD